MPELAQLRKEINKPNGDYTWDIVPHQHQSVTIQCRRLSITKHVEIEFLDLSDVDEIYIQAGCNVVVTGALILGNAKPDDALQTTGTTKLVNHGQLICRGQTQILLSEYSDAASSQLILAGTQDKSIFYAQNLTVSGKLEATHYQLSSNIFILQQGAQLKVSDSAVWLHRACWYASVLLSGTTVISSTLALMSGTVNLVSSAMAITRCLHQELGMLLQVTGSRLAVHAFDCWKGESNFVQSALVIATHSECYGKLTLDASSFKLQALPVDSNAVVEHSGSTVGNRDLSGSGTQKFTLKSTGIIEARNNSIIALEFAITDGLLTLHASEFRTIRHHNKGTVSFKASKYAMDRLWNQETGKVLIYDSTSLRPIHSFDTDGYTEMVRSQHQGGYLLASGETRLSRSTVTLTGFANITGDLTMQDHAGLSAQTFCALDCDAILKDSAIHAPTIFQSKQLTLQHGIAVARNAIYAEQIKMVQASELHAPTIIAKHLSATQGGQVKAKDLVVDIGQFKQGAAVTTETMTVNRRVLNDSANIEANRLTLHGLFKTTGSGRIHAHEYVGLEGAEFIVQGEDASAEIRAVLSSAGLVFEGLDGATLVLPNINVAESFDWGRAETAEEIPLEKLLEESGSEELSVESATDKTGSKPGFIKRHWKKIALGTVVVLAIPLMIFLAPEDTAEKLADLGREALSGMGDALKGLFKNAGSGGSSSSGRPSSASISNLRENRAALEQLGQEHAQINPDRLFERYQTKKDEPVNTGSAQASSSSTVPSTVIGEPQDRAEEKVTYTNIDECTRIFDLPDRYVRQRRKQCPIGAEKAGPSDANRSPQTERWEFEEIICPKKVDEPIIGPNGSRWTNDGENLRCEMPVSLPAKPTGNVTRIVLNGGVKQEAAASAAQGPSVPEVDRLGAIRTRFPEHTVVQRTKIQGSGRTQQEVQLVPHKIGGSVKGADGRSWTKVSETHVTVETPMRTEHVGKFPRIIPPTTETIPINLGGPAVPSSKEPKIKHKQQNPFKQFAKQLASSFTDVREHAGKLVTAGRQEVQNTAKRVQAQPAVKTLQRNVFDPINTELDKAGVRDAANNTLQNLDQHYSKFVDDCRQAGRDIDGAKNELLAHGAQMTKQCGEKVEREWKALPPEVQIGLVVAGAIATGGAAGIPTTLSLVTQYGAAEIGVSIAITGGKVVAVDALAGGAGAYIGKRLYDASKDKDKNKDDREPSPPPLPRPSLPSSKSDKGKRAKVILPRSDTETDAGPSSATEMKSERFSQPVDVSPELPGPVEASGKDAERASTDQSSGYSPRHFKQQQEREAKLKDYMDRLKSVADREEDKRPHYTGVAGGVAEEDLASGRKMEGLGKKYSKKVGESFVRQLNSNDSRLAGTRAQQLKNAFNLLDVSTSQDSAFRAQAIIEGELKQKLLKTIITSLPVGVAARVTPVVGAAMVFKDICDLREAVNAASDSGRAFDDAAISLVGGGPVEPWLGSEETQQVISTKKNTY